MVDGSPCFTVAIGRSPISIVASEQAPFVNILENSKTTATILNAKISYLNLTPLDSRQSSDDLVTLLTA